MDLDAERQLTAVELDTYINAPMTAEERTEIESLIDWFMRAYQTPASRLAYARRAYARARRLRDAGRTATD